MRVSASDFYARYRPSACGLRVYLREHGEAAAEPGPYEEVLRLLGDRHERAHLATFENVVDVSQGDEHRRLDQTRVHMTNRAPVMYQAAFLAELVIGGIPCVIRGDPDLLILDDIGYAVRACKISLRVNEADHPEILRQLELYGWLYEQVAGTPPRRLEVFNGRGELIPVEYDGGDRVLRELEELVKLKTAANEPIEPVGWTKCNGCPFQTRCWSLAEQRRDVALVLGVDQSLARSLYTEGIHSIDELLDAFDVAELSEFKKPRGTKMVRVGNAAAGILRSAECLSKNAEVVLEPPALPDGPNLVMLDLEGLPPQLDELDKIFLWGTQVFGTKPSAFNAALAGFGQDGDREGWEAFLANAKTIFDEYGDVPFVHWHHYERTKLKGYVARHGDRDGVASRVESNLIDLLPITQKAIVLPLASYSLKVVEKYVGFKRRIEEGRGDWAMAKYIEACETENEATRKEVMQQVLDYNREDLEATWAVVGWLRARFAHA